MNIYYRKKLLLNRYRKNKIFKKRIEKLCVKNKISSKNKIYFKKLFKKHKEFLVKKLVNKKKIKKKIPFLGVNRTTNLIFLLKKKKHKVLRNYSIISFYLNKYKSIKNNNKYEKIKNKIIKIKKISKKLKNLARDTNKSVIDLNTDFFFIFSIFDKIKNKKKKNLSNVKKKMLLKKKKFKNLK